MVYGFWWSLRPKLNSGQMGTLMFTGILDNLPIGPKVVHVWDYLNYRILNINHKQELLRGLWVADEWQGMLARSPTHLNLQDDLSTRTPQTRCP